MPSKSEQTALHVLLGSIAKWEAIVAGTGTDDGRKNCPLCFIYCDVGKDTEPCDGCPIQEHTSMPYCMDSPYEAWCEYINSSVTCHPWRSPISDFPKENQERATELAQAELDYLKSLYTKLTSDTTQPS